MSENFDSPMERDFCGAVPDEEICMGHCGACDTKHRDWEKEEAKLQAQVEWLTRERDRHKEWADSIRNLLFALGMKTEMTNWKGDLNGWGAAFEWIKYHVKRSQSEAGALQQQVRDLHALIEQRFLGQCGNHDCHCDEWPECIHTIQACEMRRAAMDLESRRKVVQAVSDNLIEAIQKRCTELREEYIPAYESIGREGTFAVAIMKATIVLAEHAVATGDTVGMVGYLQELRDFKL